MGIGGHWWALATYSAQSGKAGMLQIVCQAAIADSRRTCENPGEQNLL